MSRNKRLHIGVIPDGNRRWAKERSFLPWKGHEASVGVFENILDFCRKNPRVATLTVWLFSTENWQREQAEVQALMAMLERYLKNKRQVFHDRKTRVRHSGRRDRLPASLLRVLDETVAETARYEEFTLNLALDYGGRDEISRAHAACIKERESSFEAQLDNADLGDIDLVIRTSGEKRTSGFFPWQSAYAEWIFLEKFFPDMTAADMEEALQEFERRQRRFGS